MRRAFVATILMLLPFVSSAQQQDANSANFWMYWCNSPNLGTRLPCTTYIRGFIDAVYLSTPSNAAAPFCIPPLPGAAAVDYLALFIRRTTSSGGRNN